MMAPMTARSHAFRSHPAPIRAWWPAVVGALLALFVVAGAPATAAAKGKKAKPKATYHFELSTVEGKDADADKAKLESVLPVLTKELDKAFASHEQLVADLEGAPDPEADPKGYKKYLTKKKITGSFKVNVEVTLYREELEDATSGNGDKRLVVRLELSMFGETIPDRKMGFQGEGSSTIKQDVGKKVRKRDHEFAVQSAIELAVADAMAESLQKLSEPPPAKKKK